MDSPKHYFVSDTHFCEWRPEHIDGFERVCALPQEGDTLLLLGDIFEIWVGDDIISATEERVESILKVTAERGVDIRFMVGNRDFMVGRGFCRRTLAKYLPDPSRWTLPDGSECVLTHGDYFCTDDKNYRRYRRIVRNPLTQSIFRRLSRKKRVSIANNIRAKSKTVQNDQDHESYDANQALIQRYYRKFHPLRTIIMGHTHLPDVHRETNYRQEPCTRIVLGDWRKTLWYGVASEQVTFQLFEATLDLEKVELRHSV